MSATSPGAASGCPGTASAAPATLTITLAGNDKTYCLRVGGTLRLSLRGTNADPWLRPQVSGGALTLVPGSVPTAANGITVASYAAVRPGQATVTSVRPPCGAAVPYRKGDFEPAFPAHTTYPRFCPSGYRFSVSIIVPR